MHKLPFEMTAKMIISTEHHLRRRGQSCSWFGRPAFNAPPEASSLYQAHRVCERCWHSYLMRSAELTGDFIQVFCDVQSGAGLNGDGGNSSDSLCVCECVGYNIRERVWGCRSDLLKR